MRIVENPQMKFGEVPIENIKIDLKSRDDIPPLLLGLQYIYTNLELRDKVFAILEDLVAPGTDSKNGRPGMELWKIFVFGVLRLNLNWDYDRLQQMVNNHRTIRQMVGHSSFDDEYEYKLQTLRDNVTLLTPEILARINEVVVLAGHNLVKKKDDEKLRGRCDSFVVETNVHYPTDINLLYDAMRKAIQLVTTLCTMANLTGWRQNSHNLKKIKQLFRKAQQLKRSTSKTPEKQQQREQLIIEAHQAYIDIANDFSIRVRNTIGSVDSTDFGIKAIIAEIKMHLGHADRQRSQIYRRVVKGETIPHNEKVFSIFQEHTEWISKGKAGVPVELGLKVCVVEDQYGFILNHRVMQNETDDQVAVSLIRQTLEKFSHLSVCSFDKGFHSPVNQKELKEQLDLLVLPKKGKLSQADKEREYSSDFIKARHQHSAVESAINALEVHGLDRCPDHGIHGFERYVAIAILARNIQQLGVKLKRQLTNLKLAV
jgi:hypothetical protein